MKDSNKNYEQNENLAKENIVSDEQLEQVTGGFTLWDSCRGSYDRGTCWGLFAPCIPCACGHLKITKTDKEVVDKYTDRQYYTVSCGKGCFTGVGESFTEHH